MCGQAYSELVAEMHRLVDYGGGGSGSVVALVVDESSARTPVNRIPPTQPLPFPRYLET